MMGWLPIELPAFTPPAPLTDAEKLAVREILAAAYRGAGSYVLAGSVLAGDYDRSNTFQAALAAYKREKAK